MLFVMTLKRMYLNVPPVDKETKHDTKRQNVPIKNATAMHRKKSSVFLV